MMKLWRKRGRSHDSSEPPHVTAASRSHVRDEEENEKLRRPDRWIRSMKLCRGSDELKFKDQELRIDSSVYPLQPQTQDRHR